VYLVFAEPELTLHAKMLDNNNGKQIPLKLYCYMIYRKYRAMSLVLTNVLSSCGHNRYFANEMLIVQNVWLPCLKVDN